jgi:hypothetical protein
MAAGGQAMEIAAVAIGGPDVSGVSERDLGSADGGIAEKKRRGGLGAGGRSGSGYESQEAEQFEK